MKGLLVIAILALGSASAKWTYYSDEENSDEENSELNDYENRENYFDYFPLAQSEDFDDQDAWFRNEHKNRFIEYNNKKFQEEDNAESYDWDDNDDDDDDEGNHDDDDSQIVKEVESRNAKNHLYCDEDSVKIKTKTHFKDLGYSNVDHMEFRPVYFNNITCRTYDPSKDQNSHKMYYHFQHNRNHDHTHNHCNTKQVPLFFYIKNSGSTCWKQHNKSVIVGSGC